MTERNKNLPELPFESLTNCKPSGNGFYIASCPSTDHNDRNPSFAFIPGKIGRCKNPACGFQAKIIKNGNRAIQKNYNKNLKKKSNNAFRLNKLQDQSIGMELFLNQREVILEIAKELEIKFLREGQQGFIAFPYNKGKAYKLRNIDTKEFSWIENTKNCDIFNSKAITQYPQEPLIVVEGEMDVCAFKQMSFNRVISPANGASALPKELDSYFVGVPEIILAFDNDQAGKIGNKRWMSALGADRSLVLDWKTIWENFLKAYPEKYQELHIKDANDFLIAGTSGDINFPDPENSKRKAEFLKKEINKLQKNCGLNWYFGDSLIEASNKLLDAPRLPTGFVPLDNFLDGGLPMNALTGLVAYTSLGKSEIARHIAINNAKRNQPIFLIDVELGPGQIGIRSKEQLGSEVLGKEAGIENIHKAGEKILKDLPCFKVISGHHFENPKKMFSKLKQYFIKNDISKGLVILDSVQRLASKVKDPRIAVKELLELSEGFVNECFEKDIILSLLYITEQNRPKEGSKRNKLSLLTSGAESRSTEFIADLYLALEQNLEDEDNTIDLHVIKNRRGHTGKLDKSFKRIWPHWQMKMVDSPKGEKPGAPDTLDERLIDFVDQNPSSNLTKIRKSVRGSNQRIESTLTSLLKKGVLLCVHQNGSDRYFYNYDREENNG